MKKSNITSAYTSIIPLTSERVRVGEVIFIIKTNDEEKQINKVQLEHIGRIDQVLLTPDNVTQFTIKRQGDNMPGTLYDSVDGLYVAKRHGLIRSVITLALFVLIGGSVISTVFRMFQ